jgi:Carboxypeptidase regulatory-like domain/TonB-dependent Receptor Plug Domain
MRMKMILPGLLLASLAAVRADAQVVFGRVVDAADGSAVSGAMVSALDSAGTTLASALSDARGQYELALPAGGSVRLQAARVGYNTGRAPAIAVGEGDRIGFELRINAAVVVLDAVEVEAVAREIPASVRHPVGRRFYERMRSSRGYYLTPDRIAQMDAEHTSALLRSVPGVSFTGGVRGSGLRLGGAGTGCMANVYIDGALVRNLRTGVRIDDLVEPDNIFAVEVYHDVQDIPPDIPREEPSFLQFRDGVTRCGAVVIWTLGSQTR